MAERIISIEKTLLRLAEEKKYSVLKEILITINPSDIAALLESMPEHIAVLFRLLPKALAADTFVEMDSDSQELLIRGFSDFELRSVIEELAVDDAADLIDEMPANVVRRILKQADSETRKAINEILQYPDDSAGSIMTMEFVTLRPDMTVTDAIERIRNTGVDSETINTCYVIDAGRHLLGAVSIRTIILAQSGELISDIMNGNPISVYTTEDKEDTAGKLAKYNFTVLPVVDRENRMVGIVTVDDAIDVITAEATEDIEKMAAITPSDRPYLKMSAFEIWKSRIPWLLLLMISATFTGMIITRFEGALAAYVALTAYIPMLMDTGGNSGSQASVTIIRGLSLNELTFSDIFKIVWKEFRVSILCGLTLAVCNFAKLMLFDHVSFAVAAVVCITLASTVVVAKLVGCTMPLFAKKIGFDPAVMASPFITTIVDALSLLLYFRFAAAILGI